MADKLHPEKAYECKGRIQPTNRGKKSFCYRIKKTDPGDFEVQFHSVRTGKLIGYLAPHQDFTTEREKALVEFSGFRINVEFQMQRIFQDAEDRSHRVWSKSAKALLKKIKKEAEKKS